jgi:hypothetical protein
MLVDREGTDPIGVLKTVVDLEGFCQDLHAFFVAQEFRHKFKGVFS